MTDDCRQNGNVFQLRRDIESAALDSESVASAQTTGTIMPNPGFIPDPPNFAPTPNIYPTTTGVLYPAGSVMKSDLDALKHDIIKAIEQNNFDESFIIVTELSGDEEITVVEGGDFDDSILQLKDVDADLVVYEVVAVRKATIRRKTVVEEL